MTPVLKYWDENLHEYRKLGVRGLEGPPGPPGPPGPAANADVQESLVATALFSGPSIAYGGGTAEEGHVVPMVAVSTLGGMSVGTTGITVPKAGWYHVDGRCLFTSLPNGRWNMYLTNSTLYGTGTQSGTGAAVSDIVTIGSAFGAYTSLKASGLILATAANQVISMISSCGPNGAPLGTGVQIPYYQGAPWTGMSVRYVGPVS